MVDGFVATNNGFTPIPYIVGGCTAQCTCSMGCGTHIRKDERVYAGYYNFEPFEYNTHYFMPDNNVAVLGGSWEQ